MLSSICHLLLLLYTSHEKDSSRTRLKKIILRKTFQTARKSAPVVKHADNKREKNHMFQSMYFKLCVFEIMQWQSSKHTIQVNQTQQTEKVKSIR